MSKTRTVVRIVLSPRGAQYFHLERNPARGDDDKNVAIDYFTAFNLLGGKATASVELGDDKGACLEGEDEIEFFSP